MAKGILNSNTIIAHAKAIGDELERTYPAAHTTVTKVSGMDYEYTYPHVPAEHAEAIADHIALVVAEILQSWLDAGSERDSTLEDLGPAILNHVKGWTE